MIPIADFSFRSEPECRQAYGTLPCRRSTDRLDDSALAEPLDFGQDLLGVERQQSCPSLPSQELCREQFTWLRGARSRVLRNAGIGRARRIVELGCGWGYVVAELAERSPAEIVAIDSNALALQVAAANLPTQHSSRVAFLQRKAQQFAEQLADVDIVFTQCSFLWFQEPEKVLQQCLHALSPQGRLVAVEPDFGGLMEWPLSISTRQLWIDALTHAGANPLIGRSLTGLLQQLGWNCQAYLLDRYEPVNQLAFRFLLELELTEEQTQALEDARKQAVRCGQQYLCHLPYWLLVAEPPTTCG